MSKVVKVPQMLDLTETYKKDNKTIGLVVGSFDVCHLGHLNLFRFAKKHIDILIVGLDHDETIKQTKGSNRPINNFERRADFLSDLTTIDHVFLIEEISMHGTKKAFTIYKNLLEQISPSHVFTHKECDRHWEDKASLAKKFNIEFVLDKSSKVTSSGEIIKKLDL